MCPAPPPCPARRWSAACALVCGVWGHVAAAFGERPVDALVATPTLPISPSTPGRGLTRPARRAGFGRVARKRCGSDNRDRRPLTSAEADPAAPRPKAAGLRVEVLANLAGR